jgi:hypothetical protein
LADKASRGDHAGLLENQQIDFLDRAACPVRTGALRRYGSRQRNETALRQAALQRHLAALEADLVEAAGARLLALVATPGGLAQAAADAAPDTLRSVLGAGARLQVVEFHAHSFPLSLRT